MSASEAAAAAAREIVSIKEGYFSLEMFRVCNDGGWEAEPVDEARVAAIIHKHMKAFITGTPVE